jgi:transcriptional regulator with XRE-family HTH domain
VVKKRKTPPSPRAAPHEVTRTPGVVMAQDYPALTDTDETDLGDFHPDFGLAEPTSVSLPAVLVDDELLDTTTPTPRLDSGEYAAISVEGEAPESAEMERRLTPTLLKIFARRRQEIRLSLDQLARISGISLEQLAAFERERPGQAITYDQVVVLARVLGIGTEQLPGLRPRETRTHMGIVLAELERNMLSAPLLRFEGKNGERYGGDVERATSSKAFTVRIEDDSLEPILRRGMQLGFMSGTRTRAGHILLLRHRRSALLALRRNDKDSYVGLLPWQPSYVIGGEWHVVGSLEVVLPPR